MKIIFSVFLVLIILMLSFFAYPQKYEVKQSVDTKAPQFAFTYSVLNINKWHSWLWDDGGANNINGAVAGGLYPEGRVGCIYKDGLLWAGYVGDPAQPDTSLRMGGNCYYDGLVKGWIQEDGQAVSWQDPANRVYRIRQDFRTLSEEELRKDAASVFRVPEDEVTVDQMEEIQEKYETDWREWPVAHGAPYYDENHNGIYDPVLDGDHLPVIGDDADNDGYFETYYDRPGLTGADQVLWLALNDLNEDVSTELFNTPNIGIEVQLTWWAYDIQGAFDNVTFRRYRLINKSEHTVDSMYLSLFADPDIARTNNDKVGCDSISGIGFAYNEDPYEMDFNNYNLPPAAVGYQLLQGPVVQTGSNLDTAVFDFKNRVGYKNLGLNSFAHYKPGNAYIDGGIDYETYETFNAIRGYQYLDIIENPEPFYHASGPFAGNETKFPLNGDPVTGSGDVDMVTGDKRFFMSCSPFTFAPGDTQEVIYAIAGGMTENGDNLSSLTAMLNNLQTVSEQFPHPVRFPEVSHSVEIINNAQFRLQLQVDLREVDQLTAPYIYLKSATEMEFSPVQAQLFDDGQHQDGEAGDNIWGCILSGDTKKYACNIELFGNKNGGHFRVGYILQNLKLRPAPAISDYRVIWENGRQDGRINHGEKVYISFALENPDMHHHINEISFHTPQTDHAFAVDIPTNGIVNDSTLYFIYTAPEEGDNFDLEFFVLFDNFRGNYTVTLPLKKWSPTYNWRKTLDITSATRKKLQVYPVISDESQLTGHRYQISFSENADTSLAEPGDLLWCLKDLTENTVKLENQQLRENPPGDFKSVDGIEWKVFEVPDYIEAIVQVADENGPLHPDDYDEEGASYTGNNVWHDGGVGNNWFVSSGYPGLSDILEYNTGNINHRDFEMRFTETAGYGVYPFNSKYIVSTLFELWDIGINSPNDTIDDVRMIPFLSYYNEGDEDNWGWGTNIDDWSQKPCSDRIYWLDPQTEDGYTHFGENCLGFGGPGAVYDPDSDGSEEGYWADDYAIYRFLIVDDGIGESLPTGTVIRIVTSKRFNVYDTIVVIAAIEPADYILPPKFLLKQNYPNPFNGSTRIPFDVYGGANVKIEIYNLLGQKIKTLVNAPLERDYHYVDWDGKNDAGQLVPTGIYFYRMQAGNYMKARKMLFLK